MYAGLGNYGDVFDNNFGFSTPSGTALPSFTPGYDYAAAGVIKLSDPGAWGQDGFMRQPQVDDRLATFKLAAARKFAGRISSIDAGLWYSDRSKSRADHDFQFFLKNGGAPVFVDADLLKSPTSLAWAGIPGVLAYDINGAMARYFDPPNRDLTQPFDWRRNYTITEKVTTAFAKMGIDGHLGALPVHGNVGLQLVHTQQAASGIVGTSRDIGIAGGASYTNALPSLNLNLDLGQFSRDLHLRFGASRTMARARMDDLKAGTDAAVDPTSHTWSGDAGNPALRPWLADALDISVEKYFGKRSYAAAAAYSKNLKTYIYTVSLPFDFTGYPNPGGVLANTPAGNLGVISRPINGQGGRISGTEFTLSLDAGLLQPALDGLGVIGNYALTSSNIQPYGPDTTGIEIPGLSRQVASLTAYYERSGFSARISRRYRSPFRAETLGPHGDRIATEIRAEGTVDFQLGYEIQRGGARGLSFLLQVDNMTDAPYRTRVVNGFGLNLDAPETFNTYGRQVLFGVNYKR
jgi:iron complex outermembrane receptor protein